MPHPEIANPDAPHFSLRHGFHQRLPGPYPPLAASVRRVQEVQVDVLQPRALEALGDAALRVRVVDVARGDFGGVEELGAREGGGEEGGGGGGFVAVGVGGVDVSVAGGEGVGGDGFGDCCWS